MKPLKYPTYEENCNLAKDNKVPVRVSSKGIETLYPGTPRNAKCPCGSGIKYKKCCGK